MTSSHTGLESGLCLIPIGQWEEGSIALLAGRKLLSQL